MTITLNLGNPSSAAKISDLNTLLAAINASLDSIEARITALEHPAAAANPASNVFNAVGSLTDRERKEVWRMLRDGK